MQPINKHTVLKQVRNHGEWTGYIAPNNVSAFHVNGGWHIGMEITIKHEDNKYLVQSGDYTEELESALNNFKYYNCVAELGRNVRFWGEENNCECDNHKSQFYQNHGCCEACFYGVGVN